MASTADLIAEVAADTTDFKRGMSEAVSVSQTSSSSILRSLQNIDHRFEQLAATVGRVQSVFSNFGRLAIGGGILAGITSAVTKTIEGLSAIQKGADDVGITTSAFQELAFAMSNAGIATADQAGFMHKFAEEASDAGKGFGNLFEALDGYDDAALKGIRNTSDLATQMGIFANVVRAAEGEQRRAQLTTAAFGKSNEDLRRLLMGGADGLQTSIDKAREYGLVIDEELVRKAPEIEEKFRSLAAVIGAQFTQALVAGAPIIVTFTGYLAELLNNVVLPSIDGFNKLALEIGAFAASSNLADNSTAVLNQKLADTLARIDELQKKVNEGGYSFFDRMIGPSAGKNAHDDLMQAIDEAKALQDEIARRGWQASIQTTPSFADNFKPDSGPSAGRIAAGANELAKIDQDYLKATQQTTALIEAEFQQRKDKLDELLKEQVIDYGQYTKAVAELEATATVKINEEALKRVKPVTDAISGSLTRAFSDFVERGKLDFGELARDMLAKIAEVQFQLAIIQPLFGGGVSGGGGIIGNALAGVFHDGGIVGGGGRTRSVPGLAFATAPRFHSGGFPGLRSDEVPAILQRGEQVIPKGGATGGGSVNVYIQTPDVESFRRSQGQVAAMITRATAAGRRNM